jgi:lipoteichoic acid synthase
MKEMKLSINNALNRHPEFYFFFLAVIVITFQFFVLRHEVILKYDDHNKTVTYGLRAIADALTLLLPYWFLPTRYRRCIWVIILLLTIWIVSQLWYYRTYNDLMPFSSFTLFSNISPLLMKSIWASVHPIDWSIIISIVLLLISDCMLTKGSSNKSTRKTGKSICIVFSVLFIAFVHIANGYAFYLQGKGKVDNIWERYTNSNGYAYYFNMNGFVALGIYSIVEATWEAQKPTQQEITKIENYLNNYGNHYTDNAYSSPNRKNLILIIVESLNSWVINFNIDHIEVTPFLNQLCNQDSAITALRVQPQVKDGRSSDAHFMYNTGILPLKKGAVATRYRDASYPSLAKALNGYTSIEFICDDAKFWNQKMTASSYGFEEIYDRNNMPHNGTDVSKDGEMFQLAATVLKKTKQPFYAQLVTISMHQPYDKSVVPATAISQSNQYSAEIKNYLEAVHYCDSELEKFIKNLKEADLYDNSVIAIVSDHNEMDKNVIEHREKVLPEDKEIALIVLNTPYTIKYQGKLGQIDVYPTLLDIMGANHYLWKGIGQSIFRKNENRQTNLDEMWDISSLLITKGYFKDKNINETPN